MSAPILMMSSYCANCGKKQIHYTTDPNYVPLALCPACGGAASTAASYASSLVQGLLGTTWATPTVPTASDGVGRQEAPCRNSGCGKMNDVEAKKCWYCEGMDPTGKPS